MGGETKGRNREKMIRVRKLNKTCVGFSNRLHVLKGLRPKDKIVVANKTKGS